MIEGTDCFQKRSQLFVGMNNKALSVALMSMAIQIVCSRESTA
jgi:hypothetical protein